MLPKYIKFVLTLRCNLKCFTCGSYLAEQMSEMSTQEIFNIIDLICKTYKFRKKPGIRITGGEPFMRKDALDIITYLSIKGFEISLNTNGTLISEAMIEKLLKSNVKFLRVSLEGPTAEIHDKIRGVKGDFSRTVSFLRLLKPSSRNKNKDYKIITVIQENNVDYLKDMLALAQDLNFPIIFHHPMAVSENEVNLSDPEGRFKFRIREDDLSAKVLDFMHWLDNNPLKRTRFIPNLSKDEVKSFYGKNNIVMRNKQCLAVDTELRIRPDGKISICQAVEGLPCDWNRVNNLKELFLHKDFIELRKALRGKRFFDFCRRCCKLG